MRGKYLAKGTVTFNSKKLFDSIPGILRATSNFNLRVSNDNNSLSFWKHEENSAIICSINSNIFSEIRDVLLAKISDFFIRYGGIVAFMCSLEDDFWQNVTDLDCYKIHCKSIEGIHLIKREISQNTDIVDTEYNTGHSHFVNDLWFGSCWAMWFGEEYFKYIHKDMFSNFKACVFNEKPVDAVNKAWANRATSTPIDDGMGGHIYNIPVENAGYESDFINAGAKMNYIVEVPRKL